MIEMFSPLTSSRCDWGREIHSTARDKQKAAVNITMMEMALGQHMCVRVCVSLCVCVNVCVRVMFGPTVPSTLHSNTSPFSSTLGFWLAFWWSSWALSLLLYTHFMESCWNKKQPETQMFRLALGFRFIWRTRSAHALSKNLKASSTATKKSCKKKIVVLKLKKDTH